MSEITVAQIFDALTLAVRGANASAQELHRLDELCRRELEVLESHLRKILEFPNVVSAPEAGKLLERIERLRELRNMEEYGSLMLRVARDMDAVWQRIPK